MVEKLTSGARIGYDLSQSGVGGSRGAKKKLLNAAAWSGTWPAPGSTLDLDFVNDRGWVRGFGQGRVMDAITFTRASSGTYVGPDGLLKTFANQGALGVNLLNLPQDFDNAAWSKDNATIQPNAGIAPDGTYSARKIVETVANLEHRTAQAVTLTNTAHAWSVYIKPVERTWAFIGCNNTIGLSVRTFFNLSTGTVGTTPSGITAAIEDVGDGWYRCSITLSAPVASNFISVGLASADNTHVYTGDGSSGILVWGAQLETGSTPTTYYPTNINTPRFDWASNTVVPLKNLLFLTDSVSGWNLESSTLVTNVTTAPNGTSTASLFTTPNRAWRYFPYSGTTVDNVFSIYAKAAGSSTFTLRFQDRWTPQNGVSFSFNLSTGTITANPGGRASIVDVGDGWYRLIVKNNLTDGLGYVELRDAPSGVYIWGVQFENSTEVSEYIPVAHTTTNTSLAANPTVNGLLIEEARTNRALWCRDATQSNWTKTNITSTKDQTGIDGVVNSASSLTASEDNATCIQSITLASGSRTSSIFLKRLTGTGIVQATLDGSTWSTVDLSDAEWRRVSLSGSVTNPCVGVRLATSGDAVAMDFAQIEDGAFATSPILTTGATATRAADNASLIGETFRSFYVEGPGFAAAKFSSFYSTNVNQYIAPFTICSNYLNSISPTFRTNGLYGAPFNTHTTSINWAPITTPYFTMNVAIRFNEYHVASAFSNRLNLATWIFPYRNRTTPRDRLLIGYSEGAVSWLNGCMSRVIYGSGDIGDNALLGFNL
jgi:hypothetical protein